METNLTPQEEIQRLNTIISILLEQVAVLKQENKALKTGNGIENNNYTMDKNMDGIKNSIYDYPENMHGTKDFNSDHDENMDGIKNPNHDYVENMDGIKNPNHDNTENVSGIKSLNHDNTENIGGIKNINQASVNSADSLTANNLATGKTNNAPQEQNTGMYEIAPAIIDDTTTNIIRLAAVVRKSLHTRVPIDTCMSVARELLFIHNNGAATGHELRKAAGLSVAGFAKHLPMIKRRSLIYKKGVKKYALTPFSMQLINKAFGTL